jgi:poly-gamma-glutamate system protein
MKWRTDETPFSSLLFLTGLAILCMVLAERSVNMDQQPFYNQKLRAAKTMLIAMNTIKSEAVARGASIDLINDPNNTGMIGQEFTLITTDRGDLPAKLTTTNPNFAAVVVDMLTKAKLTKGDVVAVAVTGSFPCLNIAVLAACETLDLKPIVITSVGSSSWGANDPKMAWPDMEKVLNDHGILHTRSIAASVGGGKDQGRGLSPEGRDLIMQSIQRNGVPLLSAGVLEENIQTRIKMYDRAAGQRKIKAYINVGGGVASLGAPVNGDLFPSGLSRNAAFRNYPTKGVMILMGERGIPVIHLLNITDIASRYKLPIDPAQSPELGQGPVYFREVYDRLRLSLIALLMIGVTVLVVRLNLSHYLAHLRQIRTRGLNPGSSLLPPLEDQTNPQLRRSKETL